MHTWSAGEIFLERLYDVFDSDGSNSIEINEFLEGMAILIKGSPMEKLECKSIMDLPKC